MKALFFLLATTVCLSVYAKAGAQATNDRDTALRALMKNAQIIREEAEFSPATTKELQQALKLLKEAKRIVLGKEVGDSGSAPVLKCVARDNDGRAPFVYSYLKSDLIQVKITGAQFTTESQCQRSLSEAISFKESKALCISRDGDDRAPWVISALSLDSIVKSDALKFTSYSSCVSSFEKDTVISGKAVFCTSRDGDDRAPYILGTIDTKTGVVGKGEGQYSSLSECRSILAR